MSESVSQCYDFSSQQQLRSCKFKSHPKVEVEPTTPGLQDELLNHRALKDSQKS